MLPRCRAELQICNRLSSHTHFAESASRSETRIRDCAASTSIEVQFSGDRRAGILKLLNARKIDRRATGLKLKAASVKAEAAARRNAPAAAACLLFSNQIGDLY